MALYDRARVLSPNMDVSDREKKILSLEVLMGIFVDIYKKCFYFQFEAPKILSLKFFTYRFTAIVFF